MTERKVEAEDRPAAMMPASTSVPTNFGIMLKAVQIMTRWESCRLVR